MEITATSAYDVEKLMFKPKEKVRQLVISPDRKHFASLLLTSLPLGEKFNWQSRLVTGTLQPLRAEASFALPRQLMEDQSLAWLPTDAGQPSKNGMILVGTPKRRYGFTAEATKITPVYDVPTLFSDRECFQNSTLYQGLGWTLWGFECRGPNLDSFNKDFQVESWDPATGKTRAIRHLPYPKLGNWTTIRAIASPADGLFFTVGTQVGDVLLYQLTPQGTWKSRRCPKTSTGYAESVLLDRHRLYLGFQWPGDTKQLDLETDKWGPDRWGVEDPMSLAIQGDYLYVGLRFGGIERYPLAGGKPVSLYLSPNIKVKK